MAFIDIHNHSLFGVDDGPDDISESIKMIKSAKAQGIETIILTPHYRHGMFPYDNEAIEKNFVELKKRVSEEKIDIKLYLGCEYHVNSEIMDNIQSKRIHTLADTDYVLTEYSHVSEYSFIKEYTHTLIANGYTPVIAHIERYGCIQKKPELANELSNMGALVQINANSVLGLDGKQLQKICKKLLKIEAADVVASDSHDMNERAMHMTECQEYVAKKYGEEYATYLFVNSLKGIDQDITTTN